MFSDVQISWYKKQQKYMKYRSVGEDINIWYSIISLAENLNITGLLLDNGHLDLLSSSILAEIPPLGWARFCIGIYYKIKKSNIFLQWQPTSLLRLLIILGDEDFLWKISVADALIFIWRRIPAYSKDKCLLKFRLELLVISRKVKENLYSNDSYMISKRTFIQFQDTDFLLLQSKIISIHIM